MQSKYCSESIKILFRSKLPIYANLVLQTEGFFTTFFNFLFIQHWLLAMKYICHHSYFAFKFRETQKNKFLCWLDDASLWSSIPYTSVSEICHWRINRWCVGHNKSYFLGNCHLKNLATAFEMIYWFVSKTQYDENYSLF